MTTVRELLEQMPHVRQLYFYKGGELTLIYNVNYYGIDEYADLLVSEWSYSSGILALRLD